MLSIALQTEQHDVNFLVHKSKLEDKIFKGKTEFIHVLPTVKQIMICCLSYARAEYYLQQNTVTLQNARADHLWAVICRWLERKKK